MPSWVWIAILLVGVAATIVGLLAGRHRDDAFADASAERDDGATEAPSLEADRPAPAPDAAVRRVSLEERFRTAAQRLAAPESEIATDGAVAVPVRAPETSLVVELRPLAPKTRAKHVQRWQALAANLGEPGGIVEADAFVRAVMTERGLPVDAPMDEMTEASIAYPDLMDPYRLASAIATEARDGRVTPQRLRQASVHYRDVAERLLAEDPVAVS